MISATGECQEKTFRRGLKLEVNFSVEKRSLTSQEIEDYNTRKLQFGAPGLKDWRIGIKLLHVERAICDGAVQNGTIATGRAGRIIDIRHIAIALSLILAFLCRSHTSQDGERNDMEIQLRQDS
jgi:hypothetical protein